MSGSVYLLDSEGLSRAVRGDREMGATLLDADQEGIGVITTSMTLIEAYDQRVKRGAWQWTLSKMVVRPVTHELSDRAIELLTAASMHGHQHAIDAVVAAVALAERGDVTIFTSDADDMRRLCGDRVAVVKL